MGALTNFAVAENRSGMRGEFISAFTLAYQYIRQTDRTPYTQIVTYAQTSIAIPNNAHI